MGLWSVDLFETHNNRKERGVVGSRPCQQASSSSDRSSPCKSTYCFNSSELEIRYVSNQTNSLLTYLPGLLRAYTSTYQKPSRRRSPAQLSHPLVPATQRRFHRRANVAAGTSIPSSPPWPVVMVAGIGRWSLGADPGCWRRLDVAPAAWSR